MPSSAIDVSHCVPSALAENIALLHEVVGLQELINAVWALTEQLRLVNEQLQKRGE